MLIRLLCLASTLSIATSLSVSYRLAVDPSWGCVTLLGQTVLALNEVAKGVDDANLIAAWATTAFQGVTDYQKAELRGYCGAFYDDHSRSACNSVNTTGFTLPPIRSPLLRKVKDIYISNNYYITPASFNSQRDELEREVLDAVGCSQPRGTWISEYHRSDNDTYVKACTYKSTDVTPSACCSLASDSVLQSQIHQLVNDERLGSLPEAMSTLVGDQQTYRIFHSALNSIDDIYSLLKFIESAAASGTRHFLRITAFQDSTCSSYVGSWMSSMTLKNSEYKTINEAQSAGEEKSSGMQASTDDAEVDEDNDPDSETEDNREKDTELPAVTIADLVRNRKLLQSLGSRTLRLIAAELALLKSTGSSKLCLAGQKVADENSLDRYKLSCLAEIVTNVPSFIEDLYATEVTPAMRNNLRKSLAALHREIHPRWNALLLNSKTLGSSPSSSSMSASMSLGYIFDILGSELQPLALQHEKLLKIGVAPKVAKDLLQGRRLSDTPQDLYKMASLIYDRAIDANQSSAGFFQFHRRRWDYRSYPHSIKLKTYQDFVRQAEGIRVTPSNFLTNIRRILIAKRSNAVVFYDFNVHDIHLVLDLGEFEDIRLLNEVLLANQLLNGATIHFVPAVTEGNKNGLILTKLLNMWASTGKACHIERWSQLTEILSDIEENETFSPLKRLSCIEITDNDIEAYVKEPHITGLQSPAIFVNGQGVQFSRGSVPVGISDAPSGGSPLIVELIEELKEQDFRSVLYSLISLTTPMFSLGDPPMGAQIFQSIRTTTDISRILSSNSSSRVLPLITQIMQRASKNVEDAPDYDTVWPGLSDFFLVSSTPVFHGNNPLNMLHFLPSLDADDLPNFIKSFLKASESTLDMDLPPSMPNLSSQTLEIKSTEVLLPTMPLTIVLCTRQPSLLTDEKAWKDLYATVSAEVMNVKKKLELGVRVRILMMTPSEMAARPEHKIMLPASWRAAVKDQFLRSSSEPLWFIRSPITFLPSHNLALGIRDAVATAYSAFSTTVFDCLANTLRFKYSSPLCPHLLPQNEALSPDGKDVWWDLALQRLLADEVVLKPVQSLWSAWTLFDKSSLKSIRLSASNDDSLIPLSFKAVVDPLSKWGQYIIPTLEYLYRYLGAPVQILLNPSSAYNDLPLNRWSRSVIQPPLTWEDNLLRMRSEAPVAKFDRVETNETLTGALEAPSHWVTVTKEARLDLDNIRQIAVDSLRDGARHLTVDYEIRGLYVEGPLQNYLEDGTISHSDFSGGNSLVLNRIINGTEIKASDTISIRRPNYYQLKVDHPGLYRIRLLNDKNKIKTKVPTLHDTSEAEEVVELFEVALADSSLKKTDYVPVELDSFDAKLLPLPILGKELPLEEGKSYFGSALKSLWSYLPKGSVDGGVTSSEWDSKTVHIFSLASGHLYERLLRIMALSVRKHTDRKLVFWILDNFLSAKFKDRMQKMTEIYPGMQVRYVTYKWPTFLRPQVEKQRQIWAYKILFLDVLFPLQVPKIIYIDADQVVRADVGELWDLDLGGRVYAFTPFCNDRPETAKFRFWESGYWKKHLDGRPYHISALFVVDLIRYREQQVGSDLREIYNTLSADPNSLANLDQDLPNFAQGPIPIYSLPQEWLWCETWCSDRRKKYAKTIDLCNNPLTHETKLSQATRMVEEWVAYDQELQDKLEEESILENQQLVAAARKSQSDEL